MRAGVRRGRGQTHNTLCDRKVGPARSAGGGAGAELRAAWAAWPPAPAHAAHGVAWRHAPPTVLPRFLFVPVFPGNLFGPVCSEGPGLAGEHGPPGFRVAFS